jgi:putative ABC transport system permease protein
VLRAVSGVPRWPRSARCRCRPAAAIPALALDPRQAKESALGSIYVSGDSLVKTFGLQLVEGRDFLAPELVDVNETTENVYPPGVIITKPLADKLWPGASAIGKTMYFGTGAKPSRPASSAWSRT